MKELDGVVETYYSNGQLESRETYKDGKLNGLCETWDRDGNLVESTTYKNGKVADEVKNGVEARKGMLEAKRD